MFLWGSRRPFRTCPLTLLPVWPDFVSCPSQLPGCVTCAVHTGPWAEKVHVLRVSLSLNFLMILKQGALYFYVVVGPTNDVTGSGFYCSSRHPQPSSWPLTLLYTLWVLSLLWASVLAVPSAWLSSPQSSRDSHPHLLCVSVSVRHTLTAPFILQTISVWSLLGCIFFSLYYWPPYLFTFFLVIMLFVYYQYFSLWDIIGFMKARIFICFFHCCILWAWYIAGTWISVEWMNKHWRLVLAAKI